MNVNEAKPRENRGFGGQRNGGNRGFALVVATHVETPAVMTARLAVKVNHDDAFRVPSMMTTVIVEGARVRLLEIDLLGIGSLA